MHRLSPVEFRMKPLGGLNVSLVKTADYAFIEHHTIMKEANVASEPKELARLKEKASLIPAIHS